MARLAIAIALVAALCLLPGTHAVVRYRFNVGPNITCPGNPLDACSLYFAGNQGQIPEISISSMADVPLTGRLVSQAFPKATIVVSRSGPELMYQAAPAGTNADGINPYINDIFYLGGKPATLRLRPRAKRFAKRYLANRCILLPVVSAQLSDKLGQEVCNFNPDQLNTRCNNWKRCVIFKTKP